MSAFANLFGYGLKFLYDIVNNYGIAIISFLIGGFFFVVYSAIGDELDIDHEDYEPSSHSSYSGGYSSSYSSNTISDMEYQRIIQDFQLCPLLICGQFSAYCCRYYPHGEAPSLEMGIDK